MALTLKQRVEYAEKFWKPADLARAAGKTSSAVAQWKNKSKSLKGDTVAGLAALTGWPPDWWAAGKGPLPAPPKDGSVPSSEAPAYIPDLVLVIDSLMHIVEVKAPSVRESAAATIAAMVRDPERAEPMKRALAALLSDPPEKSSSSGVDSIGIPAFTGPRSPLPPDAAGGGPADAVDSADKRSGGTRPKRGAQAGR